MRDAFDESLFKFIKKRLELEFKETKKYEGDEYAMICDDLLEAIDLCDKLLTYDYFASSESVIDKWCKKQNLDSYSFMCKNWELIYNININEKKKDIKKLFSIIINNCEDWANV